MKRPIVWVILLLLGAAALWNIGPRPDGENMPTDDLPSQGSDDVEVSYVVPKPIDPSTLQSLEAELTQLPSEAPSFWTGYEWERLSLSEQAFLLAGMKGLSIEF